MRQVPHDTGKPAFKPCFHHALIGSGRLSRHFAHYFSQLGLSHEIWGTPRNLTSDFFRKKDFTHLWILVSDSAIEEVTNRVSEGYANAPAPVLLHASGALVIPGARSAHPLMTFGNSLYDRKTYEGVPFVIERKGGGESKADFQETLGGLPNRSFFLSADKKSLYHALVSMSGNFPSLLWSEVFRRFEGELDLPREVLVPFLQQSLANIVKDGEKGMTGPLVRGDQVTIGKHLDALGSSPLRNLYRSFQEFFKTRGERHVEREKQL